MITPEPIDKPAARLLLACLADPQFYIRTPAEREAFMALMRWRDALQDKVSAP